MCDKRTFGSKRHARESVAHMHESVRVYYCDSCHGYHTTKERNGKAATNARAWRARADRGQRARMNDKRTRESN